jgi:isoamylase
MDATTLLVVNAHHDALRFTLPEVVGGRTWRCLLGTNVPERDDAVRFRTGDDYEVAGRSLLLFALEPEGKPSVALRRAARALREVAETPVPVVVGNGEPAIQETQGTSRKQEVAAPDPDEKTAPALQRDRAGRSRPTMASEPKIVRTRYKRILDDHLHAHKLSG